ncbi:type IX secretion system anionic LPS delivery protein PorZ [Marinigracilibium pacificum]|uniref:PorZ N-terminal beta-propeller domain-containing protein n=1 Tax=Marinigracilibium pacificum TaxID=2729599 RepID=A0A848J5P0_9BACT|nr:hypothetical protein [Marinigracilibium pacificum]NMM49784.1 hypothetical protein [Marinigracilibium pacificum]
MKLDAENVFLPDLNRLIKFFILSILFCANSFAQEKLPTGSWETHYSYDQVELIGSVANEIVAISNPGLFSYNPSEGWIDKINPDEFPNSNITALNTDNGLILGFENGSILRYSESSILVNEELVSPSDDFKINSIQQLNNLYFLGTNEGLVTVNIETLEVRDAFLQIGENASNLRVFDIAFFEDSIYISSNEGIKSASLNTNLADFNKWNTVSQIETKEFYNLNAGLFALSKSGSLLERNEFGIWNDITDQPSSNWVSGVVDNNSIFLVNDNAIYKYEQNTFTLIEELSSDVTPTDIIISTNQYYLGTSSMGLIKIEGSNTSSIYPSGPISNSPTRIKVSNGKLFSLNEIGEDEISYYDNLEWLSKSLFDAQISDVEYINNTYYFTSNNAGLISGLENSELLTGINPVINVIPGTGNDQYQFTSIANLNGSLTFTQTNSVVYLYKDTDTGLLPFAKPDSRLNYTRKLSPLGSDLIALTGNLPSGNIVIIDSENQDYRIFTATENNGNLPGNIFCFDIDSDERIWIGTNNGVYFMDIPFGVFDFVAVNADRPIFEGRYLLEGRTVNDLLIDSGDRLWTATDLGVRVFDANLDEELAFFNSSNSPMPSNKVLDIEFDSSTGKIYILTDRGLVTYQSNATKPAPDYEKVSIYPNPYSLQKDNTITLTNLKNNSRITITTAGGSFIDEVSSNGGTATWTLPNGIAPGVYLFYTSDRFGEEGFIGKAVIIP